MVKKVLPLPNSEVGAYSLSPANEYVIVHIPSSDGSPNGISKGAVMNPVDVVIALAVFVTPPFSAWTVTILSARNIELDKTQISFCCGASFPRKFTLCSPSGTKIPLPGGSWTPVPGGSIWTPLDGKHVGINVDCAYTLGLDVNIPINPIDSIAKRNKFFTLWKYELE